MTAKQLSFPYPMTCTLIYPDGREEQVRYGHYEAIMIVSENGWPVGRTTVCVPPQYFVTEVVRADGVKVVFHEPAYLIHEREYGDGSGRVANRYVHE